jgi:hypothetical protein
MDSEVGRIERESTMVGWSLVWEASILTPVQRPVISLFELQHEVKICLTITNKLDGEKLVLRLPLCHTYEPVMQRCVLCQESAHGVMCDGDG